ncbi:MAG TPA: ATP-binding protein [Candidatus Saccharimonadales bacterium]|nr:ATP-binding protein [Candidatus Saccharimonadales bacterium]
MLEGQGKPLTEIEPKDNPLLIIITGPPGSGKTTLAQNLSERINLPYISKDALKELMFNTLGWSDREWSKKVGAASHEILFRMAESMLSTRTSVILESNFRQEQHSDRFQKMQERYGFRALQILCTTDGQVLAERFKQRVESGERHPGHADGGNYDEFREELLRGKYEPLNLEGDVLEFDTTDLTILDYGDLFSKIEAYVEPTNGI